MGPALIACATLSLAACATHSQVHAMVTTPPKQPRLAARCDPAKHSIPYRFAHCDFVRADLSTVNLAGADLTRANLTSAILSGVDLSHATLVGTNFTNATLQTADLTGARIRATNFTNADLTNATLTSAQCGDASAIWAAAACPDGSAAPQGNAPVVAPVLKPRELVLCNPKLQDPPFDGFRCDLRAYDLSNFDLSGADLRGANLAGVQLGRAIISNADLTGANLSRANLAGVTLDGTNFTRSNLRDAHLGTTVCGDPRAFWTDAVCPSGVRAPAAR